MSRRIVISGSNYNDDDVLNDIDEYNDKFKISKTDDQSINVYMQNIHIATIVNDEIKYDSMHKSMVDEFKLAYNTTKAYKLIEELNLDIVETVKTDNKVKMVVK